MQGDTTVSFIGLGVMGRPMALNLVRGGFDVLVHNRSRPAVDELHAAGARLLTNVAQAGSSSFVVTMLPDTPDVEEVGAAILPGLQPGTVWIDMSTIDPKAIRRLAADAAARGAYLLDAPVSGGDQGARAGTLSIMVGGDAQAYAMAEPVFVPLAKTVAHVGPSGAGQVVKACNQMMVGLSMQAMAEALVVAAQAGIDLEVAIDILSGGLARCGALETRGRRVAAGDFEPGFRARLHHKDLAIALRLGEELGVPLEGTQVVKGLLAEMMSSGRGDLDHSGLADLLRSKLS